MPTIENAYCNSSIIKCLPDTSAVTLVLEETGQISEKSLGFHIITLSEDIQDPLFTEQFPVSPRLLSISSPFQDATWPTSMRKFSTSLHIVVQHHLYSTKSFKLELKLLHA